RCRYGTTASPSPNRTTRHSRYRPRPSSAPHLLGRVDRTVRHWRDPAEQPKPWTFAPTVMRTTALRSDFKGFRGGRYQRGEDVEADRKSTRLNSSHSQI